MTAGRTPTLFFSLIACQAAHSIEEYRFQLYSDFAPAQFVSRIFSPDLERGFVIANILLVLAGVACYLGPVRRGWPSARSVIWFWAILETLNGIGHILRSLWLVRYTAGTLTALPLLVLALLLGSRLADVHSPPHSTPS